MAKYTSSIYCLQQAKIKWVTNGAGSHCNHRMYIIEQKFVY